MWRNPEGVLSSTNLGFGVMKLRHGEYRAVDIYRVHVLSIARNFVLGNHHSHLPRLGISTMERLEKNGKFSR